ncbi:2-hydroxyisoflavanone dehydratase [Glycine max]|nr:2-hydroxyisoflavanone dehydratase [Glycine max]
MGTLIRIFSDGTIERPLQTPFVPLKLDEPHTGLSSKDVVISHNLPVSALVYLPKLTNEADKVPILVYFHGGGFVIESAFSQRYHNFFKTFVPQVNIIVVSVE